MPVAPDGINQLGQRLARGGVRLELLSARSSRQTYPSRASRDRLLQRTPVISGAEHLKHRRRQARW